MGCYRDTGNRAIPTIEGTDPILDGGYRSRQNAIAKCAIAASKNGYHMFAVQHGGWCAASATAENTFDKYDKSSDCQNDGEGGPWANNIYVIQGWLIFYEFILRKCNATYQIGHEPFVSNRLFLGLLALECN